ncbi:amidase [Phreatobacter aquaticus]|uniref:Amidase n=1 Tax=Phreatobacter aquaticus TaxID=2570229 RepID=A0A4D7QPL9_9HYPH|nr:amidase [Phreatobacter aquaticus]QCK87893.1 amidase [Phreatobacter aquaticus]
MAHDELNRLTATAAADAIRRGDITSEALVGACLDRIGAREAEVGAFIHLDPGHALSAARAADETRRQGLATGPLHGVPVAIKDVIDTADYPTEHGSKAFPGNQPEADAACVAALRAVGAIILGKTVTTELAARCPGKTRNPHNLAHTPGGSSSGSAAAVADAMVPLALGTQTGGSVIRPASFCGIYGFKPTFGLIPRPGVLTQSHSLDTVGVMARSLEDLALAGEVLQGHDGRDASSLSVSAGRLVETARMDWPVEPTFAFVKSPAWAGADPAMHEAFGELAEVLGARLVEVDINLAIEKGIAAARTVQMVELAHHFGPLFDRTPDLVSTQLIEMIEEGRSARAIDYAAALDARQALYSVVEELFYTHGPILTPASPGRAPLGLTTTGDPVFNAFWTYLGVPCVTLPLLEAEGLPIGVQLVGARRDDGRLLRTARLLVEELA